MFFLEEPLEDGNSLSHYNIKKGSTLILKLGSRMEIYVETASGKTLTFQVVSFDTIESIKEKIETERKIPVDQQHLFFENKKLMDNRSLSHYGIETQSTLHLKIGKSMIIFVESRNEKTFNLNVLPSDTIADVKAQIYEEKSIDIAT